MARARFAAPVFALTVPLLLALPGAARAQGLMGQSLPALPELETGVTLTPITGTPTMFQPGTGVANLDAGDLVAGTTWWQLEGVVWVETYLGFLWAPANGASVFEVPASLYFNDNLQVPWEIADNRVVVGTNIFFNQLQNRPFRWSPEDGFEFLPQGGHALGSAVAASADGSVIGGGVQQTLFTPSRAARWVSKVLDVLGPLGQSSFVWDTSDDGNVLVGENGPSAATVHATRWLDGLELGLDPVPGETASSARHVSDDGAVAVGWATVGGVNLLVRWSSGGAATVHVPPQGLSVQELSAINPSATAVVGALTDQVPFQEDQVPFVWRLGQGFRLIGELGLRDEYDRSRARDVSDDGQLVVGQLGSSVISNGFPPSIGFLWSDATGTQDLERLLIAAGGPGRGLFDASAISGDGRRILATGVVRPTIHDTTSVLIEFEAGPPLK